MGGNNSQSVNCSPVAVSSSHSGGGHVGDPWPWQQFPPSPQPQTVQYEEQAWHLEDDRDANMVLLLAALSQMSHACPMLLVTRIRLRLFPYRKAVATMGSGVTGSVAVTFIPLIEVV